MFDWQRLVSSLSERQWAHLVTVLFALLVILSVYQKIKFFTAATFSTDQNSVAATVTPLPTIANWHLFGDYTAIKASLLPKTQLNLQLQGVFFAEQLQQSQVIVAVPGQSARVYRVGQLLPGGAKIKEILRNGVAIELDGQLQWLPLKISHLQYGPVPTVNLPDTDS